MALPNEKKAKQSLNTIRASGVTALCDGLLSGIKMMNEWVKRNQTSSVLLLTGGQANRGFTTADEIIQAIKGKSVIKAYHFGKVKSGDWICPFCSDHNFASRNRCRKCNKGTKPSGLKGRAGDWDCQKCGVMKFAKRDKCFKCKAKKSKNKIISEEKKLETKVLWFVNKLFVYVFLVVCEFIGRGKI